MSQDGSDTEEFEHRDQLCAEAIRFVGRMAHTCHSLRTYDLNSPAIRFGLRGMSMAGQGMVTLSPMVRLKLLGERVHVGEFTVSPPPGMLEAANRLRIWLRVRGVAAIDIVNPPTVDDIKGMLRALESLTPEDQEIQEGDALAALEKESVSAFQFVACPPDASDDELSDEDPAVGALRCYLRLARVLQRLQEQGPEPAVLLELRRATQRLVELVQKDLIRALVLTQTHGVHPHSVHHPIQRAILALACGQRLGIQAKELEELGMCAFCCDIALYQIPQEQRYETRALTQDQLLQLYRSPLDSARQLLGTGDLNPSLCRRILVAFEFRLNADRSGYPVPLSWPSLHPFSRLLSICDIYTMMVFPPPRRKPLLPAEAVAHLREHRGRQYDALMVDELDDLVNTHLLTETP
jgi:hypothetical protein